MIRGGNEIDIYVSEYMYLYLCIRSKRALVVRSRTVTQINQSKKQVDYIQIKRHCSWDVFIVVEALDQVISIIYDETREHNCCDHTVDHQPEPSQRNKDLFIKE